jgi:hypothetical protein
MMLGAVRPGLMAAVRNLTYFASPKAPFFLVIPAKAGIQGHRTRLLPWIPAFAGMTMDGAVLDSGRLASRSLQTAVQTPLCLTGL